MTSRHVLHRLWCRGGHFLCKLRIWTLTISNMESGNTREVEARLSWLWLAPHRNPASTTPTNNKGQVIGSSTRATREYRTSLEVGLTLFPLVMYTRFTSFSSSYWLQDPRGRFSVSSSQNKQYCHRFTKTSSNTQIQKVMLMLKWKGPPKNSLKYLFCFFPRLSLPSSCLGLWVLGFHHVLFICSSLDPKHVLASGVGEGLTYRLQYRKKDTLCCGFWVSSSGSLHSAAMVMLSSTLQG